MKRSAVAGMLTLVVSSAFLVGTAGAMLKIIGGSGATLGKYPFMALLWFDDDQDGFSEPFCSGTHIGENWILTAAHCFVDSTFADASRPEDMSVLLGAVDIANDNLDGISVKRIIVHPEYNPTDRSGDVALVELSRSVQSAPIVLAASSRLPRFDTDVVAAGWGRTSENGNSSTILLETELTVRSHVVCRAIMGDGLDNSATFCAGGDPDGLRDTCTGDSGGPLFRSHEGAFLQMGIVNFGFGCARPGVPALYTRVSHYLGWISEQIDITLQPHTPTVEESTEPEFTALVEATTEAGNVRLGEDQIFEATGFNEIMLTSLSGDSDLYVFGGDTFSDSQFLCESILDEGPSSVDSCLVDGSGMRLFATVIGIRESSFTLSADQPVIVGQTPTASGGGGGGGGSLYSLVVFILLGVVIRIRKVQPRIF